jgi:hypothetical protein
MMDYRATGLPQNDMTVLKAFSTYAKNAKSLPEETGMSEDYGIKIAQIINNTAGADTSLLTLALLSTTPPAAWGLFEKSFGRDVVDQMEESMKHSRTGFAYIDQASEPVKILAMASAIAIFDELKQKNDKLDQQLTGLPGMDPMQGGMPDIEALQSLLPGMIQGMLPDTSVYGQLARSLADKTTCPQLEALFVERLEEFKQSQQEQQEKLAQFGIIVAGPGMGPMGAPSEVRYPSFDETGLLDDAKVRAAYDVLTSNPRVVPEDFEGALAAGKLLSELPVSKNPLTVAAALVDIGIRDLNQDDFSFLDKKLDWDVLDLVKAYSVRSPETPHLLATAPVEFRQIVVADLTAKMGHVREGVQDMLDKLSQPQPGMPMEMELPPELRGLMEAQAVRQMEGVAYMAQRIVRPVLGTIDAPELEAAFKQNIQAMQDFVAEHKVKQPKLLPPGNDNGFPDFPTRRKKPGTDFEF